jgi:hypothetical protein
MVSPNLNSTHYNLECANDRFRRSISRHCENAVDGKEIFESVIINVGYRIGTSAAVKSGSRNVYRELAKSVFKSKELEMIGASGNRLSSL